MEELVKIERRLVDVSVSMDDIGVLEVVCAIDEEECFEFLLELGLDIKEEDRPELEGISYDWGRFKGLRHDPSPLHHGIFDVGNIQTSLEKKPVDVMVAISRFQLLEGEFLSEILKSIPAVEVGLRQIALKYWRISNVLVDLFPGIRDVMPLKPGEKT